MCLVLYWNEITFNWWKKLIIQQELITSLETTMQSQSSFGSSGDDDFPRGERVRRGEREEKERERGGRGGRKGGKKRG